MYEGVWEGGLLKLRKQRRVEARRCGSKLELWQYLKVRADRVEYDWHAHSVLQRLLPLRLIYRLIVQFIVNPRNPGPNIDLILLVL